MRRRDCLKTVVALLANIAVSPLVFSQSPLIRSEAGRIDRQLRFTLTLTNPKSYELVDQVLWIYFPAAVTSTQTLESIKVAMPYEQHTDPLGHSILTLAFPRVAPLSTKVISLVANVSMRSEPKLEPLETPEAWLGPERYIETTVPSVQSQAAKLKCTEARDTARAIYDWVKQSLHYMGYVADDRGAAYALNQLQGDCTEYAYLAVALARANGIPARMVGGYTTDKNALLRATDYHNWAELYFDGAWRLLDAQKECWLTPTEQYVAFRFYRDAEINPIGLAHRYRQTGDLEINF
ncbi:MAG: transglutaminase domain-containing protein [Methylobacter sp.]